MLIDYEWPPAEITDAQLKDFKLTGFNIWHNADGTPINISMSTADSTGVAEYDNKKELTKLLHNEYEFNEKHSHIRIAKIYVQMGFGCIATLNFYDDYGNCLGNEILN